VFAQIFKGILTACWEKHHAQTDAANDAVTDTRIPTYRPDGTHLPRN
jgi:hypothetical protein